MLAPLTDLVGECGQTEMTKAKENKNALWHWDEKHQIAFNLVKATIVQDIVLPIQIIVNLLRSILMPQLHS